MGTIAKTAIACAFAFIITCVLRFFLEPPLTMMGILYPTTLMMIVVVEYAPKVTLSFMQHSQPDADWSKAETSKAESSKADSSEN